MDLSKQMPLKKDNKCLSLDLNGTLINAHGALLAEALKQQSNKYGQPLTVPNAASSGFFNVNNLLGKTNNVNNGTNSTNYSATPNGQDEAVKRVQKKYFSKNSSISVTLNAKTSVKNTKQNLNSLERGMSKKQLESYQQYFNARFYNPYLLQNTKEQMTMHQEIELQTQIKIQEQMKIQQQLMVLAAQQKLHSFKYKTPYLEPSKSNIKTASTTSNIDNSSHGNTSWDNSHEVYSKSEGGVITNNILGCESPNLDTSVIPKRKKKEKVRYMQSRNSRPLHELYMKDVEVPVDVTDQVCFDKSPLEKQKSSSANKNLSASASKSVSSQAPANSKHSQPFHLRSQESTCTPDVSSASDFIIENVNIENTRHLNEQLLNQVPEENVQESQENDGASLPKIQKICSESVKQEPICEPIANLRVETNNIELNLQDQMPSMSSNQSENAETNHVEEPNVNVKKVLKDHLRGRAKSASESHSEQSDKLEEEQEREPEPKLIIKEESMECLEESFDTSIEFKGIKHELTEQVVSEAKLEPVVSVEEYDELILPKTEATSQEDCEEYYDQEEDEEEEVDMVKLDLNKADSGCEDIIETLSQDGSNDLFVAELPMVKRDGRDKKLYPCKICNKVYSHYKSRYRHMWLHKGERPYTCFTCNKGFMSKSHLRDHVRTHTGEKPYKCDICDKSFIVNSSLQTHMRVHTGEKPFACDLCGERFVYRDRLMVHKRKHTGEKPFTCDICSKKLTSKYLLNIHMKAHMGLKPFKCDVCDKSFVLKRKLNVHVRIHSSEKSFKCDVCGKIFSENYRLIAHMRTHTGERPFPCTVCGKSFKENGVLTSHMRIHLGEKPFRCEVCNKCFYEKSQLNKHQKCHTGEKPYTCPICDGKFSRQQSVVRHMKLHNKGGKIRKKTVREAAKPEFREKTDFLTTPDFQGFYDLQVDDDDKSLAFGRPGEDYDPLRGPEDFESNSSENVAGTSNSDIPDNTEEMDEDSDLEVSSGDIEND